MNKWVTLVIFYVLAVGGAILAFAVDDGKLRANPLGLVIFAAFSVLVIGWAIDRWVGPSRRSAARGNSGRSAAQRASGEPTDQQPTRADAVKTVGGLIAVAVAILAIVAISLVIVLTVSGFEADKAIA